MTVSRRRNGVAGLWLNFLFFFLLDRKEQNVTRRRALIISRLLFFATVPVTTLLYRGRAFDRSSTPLLAVSLVGGFGGSCGL